MTDRTCTVDGCERPHKAKGLCGMHYQRVPRSICSVDGCEKAHQSHGRCPMHNWRWKHYGSLDNPHPYANAPAGTKWCPRCETYKPTDQFHRSRATASGLQPMCKPCALKSSQASPNYALNGSSKARKRRSLKRGAISESYRSDEIADRDGLGLSDLSHAHWQDVQVAASSQLEHRPHHPSVGRRS